jgi:hypothetical protein
MSHPNDYRVYMSPRGNPLVYVGAPRKDLRGIITVENYMKWYELYVVASDGSVHKLEYDHTINFGSHTPLPSDVFAYAERNGMEVDQRSMEMIVGRWYMEAENRDPELIHKDLGFAENAENVHRFTKRHFCNASCKVGFGHKLVSTNDYADANDLAEEYHAKLAVTR